jgi:hypothetical protein
MNKTTLAALALALLARGAPAGQLAGVTLPDTVTVAGKTLRLNGMGIRTKLFFKIYVGGLYLETPARDGAAVISADQPKRIVTHYLYKKLTRDQIVEAWEEGFKANPGGEPEKLAPEIRQFESWMTDVSAGQESIYTYEPGVGTTVEIAGQKKGTIPGVAFMHALFRVYFGDHPPTSDLKKGLLSVN